MTWCAGGGGAAVSWLAASRGPVVVGRVGGGRVGGGGGRDLVRGSHEPHPSRYDSSNGTSPSYPVTLRQTTPTARPPLNAQVRCYLLAVANRLAGHLPRHDGELGPAAEADLVAIVERCPDSDAEVLLVELGAVARTRGRRRPSFRRAAPAARRADGRPRCRRAARSGRSRAGDRGRRCAARCASPRRTAGTAARGSSRGTPGWRRRVRRRRRRCRSSRGRRSLRPSRPRRRPERLAPSPPGRTSAAAAGPAAPVTPELVTPN